MSELVCYFNSERKIEIHLILFGKKREIFFSVPEEVKIHKPDFKYDNKFRAIFALRTLLYIRQRVKTINPDALLSFGEEWNNMVLLSTLGLKYPVFISDRAEPGKKRRTVQEVLRNKLYPYSSGIIVQTKKAKEIYQKKFPQKNVEAIANPFRDKEINRTSDRDNIILSVGRLIKTKHYDLLIDMFSKTVNQDWKLVIVGGNAVKQDGMSRLKDVIREKGLSDKIILTGMVSDVDRWYRKSKIFAFTSSSEGFPNVIGEAMQYGLPVIAFDCVAGPSDLIDDGGNGYLISLFDTDEYVGKLNKLMQNSHLRKKMGNESLEKIKNFSLAEIGQKYLEFISNER